MEETTTTRETRQTKKAAAAEAARGGKRTKSTKKLAKGASQTHLQGLERIIDQTVYQNPAPRQVAESDQTELIVGSGSEDGGAEAGGAKAPSN